MIGVILEHIILDVYYFGTKSYYCSVVVIFFVSRRGSRSFLVDILIVMHVRPHSNKDKTKGQKQRIHVQQ